MSQLRPASGMEMSPNARSVTTSVVTVTEFLSAIRRRGRHGLLRSEEIPTVFAANFLTRGENSQSGIAWRLVDPKGCYRCGLADTTLACRVRRQRNSSDRESQESGTGWSLRFSPRSLSKHSQPPAKLEGRSEARSVADVRRSGLVLLSPVADRGWCLTRRSPLRRSAMWGLTSHTCQRFPSGSSKIR